MLAEMLTKEMEIPSDLEDVTQENKMVLPLPLVNEVTVIGTDVKAMFPHMEARETGRRCREKVEKSELEFEDEVGGSLSSF